MAHNDISDILILSGVIFWIDIGGNNFKELYEETTRIDPTNKILTLANSEKKNVTYSEH